MNYDIDNIKLRVDVKNFCMQLKAISMPHFNMDILIREKVNKETELEQQKVPIEFNRHNTSPNNSRVHILLNCTRNIFHDGSDVRPQNKS